MPTGSGNWGQRENAEAVAKRHALEKLRPNYTSIKSNASFQRTTRAVDGDGKCAVQISVDVSQKRPNNSRLDPPARGESSSAIMPSAGYRACSGEWIMSPVMTASAPGLPTCTE